MKDVSDINPEEYVEENRETIIKVIRHSSDSFARACAWTLIDRYSDDPDLDELHDELDAVAQRGGA